MINSGLVIQIGEGSIVFDPKFHKDLLPSYIEGKLYYQRGILELIDKMAPNVYIGGKNLAAKIDIPSRNKDTSLVHVAFHQDNEGDLYDDIGDWILLFCPMGNLLPTSSLLSITTITTSNLHTLLYKEGSPENPKGLFLDKRISDLLHQSGKQFTSVREVLTLAKKDAEIVSLDSVLESGPLPSRTSLSKEFMDYNIVPPTLEELDEIFLPNY